MNLGGWPPALIRDKLERYKTYSGEWYFTDRTPENEAVALDMYRRGVPGSFLGRYHITMIRELGREPGAPEPRTDFVTVRWPGGSARHVASHLWAGKSDYWYDIDIVDGAGTVWPVRAAVWNGDGDANTGYIGQFRRRDTNEQLVTYNFGRGEETEVIAYEKACGGFVPHPELPDGADTDELKWGEDVYGIFRRGGFWQFAKGDCQLARLLTIAHELGTGGQPFLEDQPQDLCAKFSGTVVGEAVRSAGFNMPDGVCNIVGAYMPAYLPPKLPKKKE
jgi:hypothetical protein